MSTIVAAVLLLVGTAFMLVAAIGLLRLPDLYTRMHAITKAGTLGVGLVLAGVAVSFGDLSVTTRAITAIVFVLMTAPISSHMIGRAGYLSGSDMWGGTAFDQWKADIDTIRRNSDRPDPAP
jgi:multicomponent Na+:H+ antiporter subunit G